MIFKKKKEKKVPKTYTPNGAREVARRLRQMQAIELKRRLWQEAA